ncbi:ABC-2 transporter permease [Ureibacillus thermosphaericus]|uniref:ABC-type transport system involved in multi-copper enzyme maturation permease subunit n=1 Tax=Ureibacillus thermosphaericus TaxID=51173 RepID=A0A840PS94_URETH|nr:ABC-2 transporter permease [Ureibacillus thermosphaericus]MBB5148034.1 ABC-type transport system involved in multi-copper enzyme maturation permease subunit [Ureibacillus thermosphaericus]NKZ30744.1 ABC-2 transporter permease [Ureibacillus thermosphaericus]
MLNLIRKDMILQKKTLPFMLLFLFIYLFVNVSTSWVAIVFCIVIIMNAFQTDETSSANLLLNSLPYTRKEIVSSKYIGALIFIFLTLLTIFIGNWMIHREIMQWEVLLFITSIVMGLISFAFPFSYLFNSKYLLIGFGGVFVVYMVTLSFIPNLNDRVREVVQTVLSLDNSLFYIGIILSVGLLYVLSWILSIRIYSRKVF